MEWVPLMGHWEFMVWCWNQDRDRQHFTPCLWKQLCFQKGCYAEGHIFASHQDSCTMQSVICIFKICINCWLSLECDGCFKIITSVPILETNLSIVADSLNRTTQISNSLCVYFQLVELEILHNIVQQVYFTQIVLFTCCGLLCLSSLQLTVRRH